MKKSFVFTIIVICLVTVLFNNAIFAEKKLTVSQELLIITLLGGMANGESPIYSFNKNEMSFNEMKIALNLIFDKKGFKNRKDWKDFWFRQFDRLKIYVYLADNVFIKNISEIESVKNVFLNLSGNIENYLFIKILIEEDIVVNAAFSRNKVYYKFEDSSIEDFDY